VSAATAAGAQAKPAAAAAPAGIQHWVVAPVGNEGRYIVRETLFNHDFPNDAIGKVSDISGDLFVDPTGKVVGTDSKIVINVSKMSSDQPRRDKILRAQSIESDKFPTVTLVPKSFVGLTAKPGSAPQDFDFLADLTVHGTTRPTTWKVTAHTQGPDIVGTAKTAFTFADFSLQKPKTAMVNMGLGVQDTIRLEYDFHFTQKQTP